MFTIRLFIYVGPTVVIICFITCSFAPSSGQEVIMSTPCDDICDVRRDEADCEGRMFESIEQVYGCHGVSSLDVGYNQISELRNDTLSRFRELIHLDISSNPISYIEPGCFNSNSQLETLTLSRIRIHTLLNGTFIGLSQLRKVTFWAGKLEVLEALSLTGLSSMTEIIFSLNKIQNLPATLFSDAINLELISLSVNKISNLPIGIFSHLHNLRVIELGSNRLTSIHNDIFSGLPALEKVDLRRNNLNQIPAINVKYLDLSYNLLTHVPVPIGDVQWENVYLRRNPLHCDYTIEPLRQWYACQENKSCHAGTTTVDKWSCSTPDEHNTVEIRHLSPIVTTTTIATTLRFLEKTSPSNFDKHWNQNMIKPIVNPSADVFSSSCAVVSSAVLTTLLNIMCVFIA